jgi:hypothetical protein
MSPLILPLITVVGDLLDKFIPDPNKKAEMQLEILRMDQAGRFKELEVEVAQITGQLEVNKAEAGNASVFVSGWRPFIGWTCGGGLAYQLLARPIFGWIMNSWLKWDMPPALETETLMTLLFGMLGLGAYRTVEKFKGKA